MKPIIGALFLFVFFGLGCNSKRQNTDEPQLAFSTIERDLEEIKKDGKLKALIAYSGTSYFLYKGKPMGYEYELLERLADHFEVDLEIKISKDLNMLLSDLAKGDVDIVAY